jgi:hypothetical protein
MGDTKINYNEKFGINTFKREICVALGEEFWQRLIDGIALPDIETEYQFGCSNMCAFIKRFESLADAETVKNILYKVRHGICPEQSAWAREQFLQIGNLDAFLKYHLESEMQNFEKMNAEKTEWYGQVITDEVLDLIKAHPSMLAPIREGNKLRCMAFPNDMPKYIAATDIKMKRYYACHCPFARQSILTDNTVSSTLCNCSLGHVMNFTESFLGRSLNGRVVHSVLAGDLFCEYEIDIPDDIMREYIKN